MTAPPLPSSLAELADDDGTDCGRWRNGSLTGDEVIDEAVNGPGTPAMVTAWLPTPKELAALNAGAAVRVRILGQIHPPIMVDVGEPPEPITESST